MGTDSAHRRLSVPLGPICHPGTSFIHLFLTLRNGYMHIYDLLVLFFISYRG